MDNLIYEIEHIKSLGLVKHKDYPSNPIKIFSFKKTNYDGFTITIHSKYNEIFNIELNYQNLKLWLNKFEYVKLTKINNMKNSNESTVLEQDSNNEVFVKNVTDIRSILFDSLNKLKEGNIKSDTAKTMAQVSQVILNSCKIEIEYRSKFLNNKQK